MIVFEKVSVAFGGVAALSGVDLHVADGALCVLVGPSGSGKSTLLRLVNRLIEPSAGVVKLRGDNVTRLEPTALRRSIGYVIQSVGLFPHRTVAENVATVPHLLGWPKARVARRVDEMLAAVHLDPDEIRNRFPSELSGGQAQRVGLARALAADPDLLLMDEPFGAVDPITRRSLRAELKRLHRETGKTILLVTHDPAEALELATQLVILRGGRIVAAGDTKAVTSPGAEPFVRELIGARDLALRLLDAATVRELMQPDQVPGPESVGASASLSDALARLIELRRDALQVCSENGEVIGSISLRAIVERHP